MTKLMDKARRAAKALAAAVLAAGPIAGAFMSDKTPGVTKEQWGAIVAAALVAGVGVYNIPNGATVAAPPIQGES